MASNDRIEESAVDETTPLVAAQHSGPTTNVQAEPLLKTNGTAKTNGVNQAEQENGEGGAKDDDRPLPKFQVFLLSYCRFIEPISFFSIFPFINVMIETTGHLDERDVGFYTGLIESLFSLTQMTLMITWGRLSDRFGRKPVLVGSLFCASLASALFGFSKHIWQMILFRCLSGVFSGTVVTIRTMFSEVSTPKTQARAFSWYAFATNVGILVGPLMGGALADPAHQYPKAFGHIQFFHDYPYALATMVVGTFTMSASIISAFFLEETLKKKGATQDTAPKPPMSTRELIRSPGVLMVLAIYSYIMFLAYAYTAIVPVFWYEKIEYGGFHFKPLMISIFLAVGGLAQAFWLLIPFPPLQKRFGTEAIIRWCSYAWPFFFADSPICNLFLKAGAEAAFWTIAVIGLVGGSGVAMAFTASQLALNDVAPSPDTLGTLNAIALTVTTGMRAFTPALSTALYALGVNKQIMGGQLAWVVLIIISLGLRPLLIWFPKNADKIMNGESRTERDEETPLVQEQE